MSRKPSITGGGDARKQSAAGPPVQDMVKVAVLPPRLPANMAPPTGLGAADTMSWDESVNWQHNESLKEREVSKSTKLFRKAGLTTKRTRVNEELPPFTFRMVTYETWRKHYAKDKDGRYHGTEAPAEDCLLLPEDVEKWSFGPAETKADLWTRGKAALPVYDQVPEPDTLPAYSTDGASAPLPQETRKSQVSKSTFTADGKTAQQIIDEAKAKNATPEGKQTWKDRVKKGGTFSLLGGTW